VKGQNTGDARIGQPTTSWFFSTSTDFSGKEVGKVAAGLTLTDNPCYSGDWFCFRRIEVTVTVIQCLTLARSRYG
jgi:hypothetical protein